MIIDVVTMLNGAKGLQALGDGKTVGIYEDNEEWCAKDVQV